MSRLVWIYPFVLLAALWWTLSKLGTLGNEFVLPPPETVVGRAREMLADGTLTEETLGTLRRVLTAFGLAVVVGVPLGTLIGSVPAVRRALRPLVAFLFPTPKIALYPAMVIVFGLGSGSQVAFGFSEAIFPLVLATAAGTSQVEPRLVWSAAALGRPSRLRIVVPAALPAIMTGARIALVGAIIGVFLGEMIAGADGLGHLMAAAYRTLDTPDMYVAIGAVSILGYLLDRGFLLLRSHLLVWSAEER